MDLTVEEKMRPIKSLVDFIDKNDHMADAMRYAMKVELPLRIEGEWNINKKIKKRRILKMFNNKRIHDLEQDLLETNVEIGRLQDHCKKEEDKLNEVYGIVLDLRKELIGFDEVMAYIKANIRTLKVEESSHDKGICPITRRILERNSMKLTDKVISIDWVNKFGCKGVAVTYKGKELKLPVEAGEEIGNYVEEFFKISDKFPFEAVKPKRKSPVRKKTDPQVEMAKKTVVTPKAPAKEEADPFDAPTGSTSNV